MTTKPVFAYYGSSIAQLVSFTLKTIGRRNPLCVLLIVLTMLVSACGSPTTQPIQEASTDSSEEAVAENAEEPAAESAEEPAAEADEPAAESAEEPAAEADEPPEEASSGAQLGKVGFGQNATEVGYAFIITNPSDMQIGGSEYQVSAYDTDDVVLGTDSGVILAIYPGQEVGIAGSLFVNDETVEVDRIEVQFRSGQPENADGAFEFTVGDINYMPDDFFPSASSIVSNPFDQDFSDIVVYAVAYNEAEEIIGGGFTFLEFIPAQGQAAADILITTTGEPARVDMYPMLSFLSVSE